MTAATCPRRAALPPSFATVFLVRAGEGDPVAAEAAIFEASLALASVEAVPSAKLVGRDKRGDRCCGVAALRDKGDGDFFAGDGCPCPLAAVGCPLERVGPLEGVGWAFVGEGCAFSCA